MPWVTAGGRCHSGRRGCQGYPRHRARCRGALFSRAFSARALAGRVVFARCFRSEGARRPRPVLQVPAVAMRGIAARRRAACRPRRDGLAREAGPGLRPRSANHRWAAMGRDASSAAAARRPLQGRTWRILLPSGFRPRSARERRWAAMRRRSGSAAAAAEDRQALAYPSRRQPACHRSKMEGGGIAGQQAWPAGQQALAPAAGTGGPSSPRRWGARPGRPGRPGRPKDRFHFERESERGAPRPAPAGPADRAAIARHCGSVCVPCNGRDGFRQRACNGAPCPSRPVGGRRCLRAEYIYNNII